ncbi:MAG: hypothetical protein HXX19_03240 [Rhodoferax sp.]|nr:hypothetical protein [Rhodoferax sp.]
MSIDVPALRLFLSADLIGSTALKSETSGGNDEPEWLKTFISFYEEFPAILAENCKKHDTPNIEFWKGIGDELLWFVSLSQVSDSLNVVKAFKAALELYNRKLDDFDKKVRLKGTAWIAGFPITHKVVPLPNGGTDYIGPSIDAGFRLSRFSTRMRMVVSVDLAWMLLQCQSKMDELRLCFDASESMKGVLSGRPYPVIWIQCESPLEQLEYELCHSNRSTEWDRRLGDFCADFIRSTDGKIISPFITGANRFGTPPESFLTRLNGLKDKDPVDALTENGGSFVPEGQQASVDMVVHLKVAP